MAAKILNSVGKVAFLSTAVSFLITLALILLTAENPGQLNVGEKAGIIISLILPIVISVPLAHNFQSQNQKLRQLTEQLQILHRIDSLTGLLTRAAFYQEVEDFLKVPDETPQDHAMFFIDLDNFKQINDAHGHKTGDNTLTVFGEVASKTVENGDIVGRIGGEEFCLFAPNCNAEQAAAKAQKLINRFQQQACVVDEKHIKATLSVGVCLTDECGELDGLVNKADNRMYAAKKNGKNQFVMREKIQDGMYLAA